MTRTELEHIIRAVAAITNENELIVIGSQAILGQYPNAPDKLLVSKEADIYAPARPDLSDLIERSVHSGSLGWSRGAQRHDPGHGGPEVLAEPLDEWRPGT